MHPEITRAIVQARQADLSRPSARRSAQLRSDAAGAPRRRPAARRRRFGGTVRAALRLGPLA